MRKSISLAINDIRNITRDFVNLMMLIVPIIIGFLLRFLPKSAPYFERIDVQIESYFPFVIGFFMIFPAMLCGMLVGFIILDERDENIISYFAVTPLAKRGYLTYRLFSPMLICFIFTFFVVYIPGLIRVNIVSALPAIILASLQTPITAMFMGSFAGNKLEGIAIGKIFSLVNFTPLALLIDSKYKYIAGVFPQFWVTEIFLKSYNNESIFFSLLIGIIVTFIWLGVLFRVFEKRIG